MAARAHRKSGRYPHFDRRYPETRFWLTAGLIPRCALALVKAGFLCLADLEGATRERLGAIPGVGRFTLEVIEELLGRPLPRGEKQRSPTSRPSSAEEVWRRRGLPAGAAITFVQVGMTMERLQTMTREELLTLVEVGPRAVQVCELLIGRKIPSRRRVDPVAAFWRNQGIPARAAKALSRAGIGSPEHLRAHSRESLLALPGVGQDALRRLEKILGAEIPSRVAYWLGRGLSLYVAHALFRAGLHTIEDLEALARRQFLALPRLSFYALHQCEKLLGRKLTSEPEGDV